MTDTSSLTDLSKMSAILDNPLTVRLIFRLLRRLLSSPKVWNYIKGFAIGAFLSSSIWLRDLTWQTVKGLFLAKAVFRDDDSSYDWEIGRAHV